MLFAAFFCQNLLLKISSKLRILITTNPYPRGLMKEEGAMLV